MAGTDDNILGGQDAVIRVGVEADMSEILQQATKFNELIKDANESFNVMQTVITSTTTRMASLNSATLRLVSSARQLRSEYQLIAESSQRIGFAGGLGGSEEGLIGIGGQPLMGLTGSEGRSFESVTSGLVAPAASMAGVSGAPEIPEQFPGLSEGAKYAADAGMKVFGGGLMKGRAAAAGRESVNQSGGFSEFLQNLIAGGASGSTIGWATLGRIIPGLGKIMGGAAAPYILSLLGAGVAGYKAADYMIKGSTKYTGLTGGTGVFSSAAEGDYNIGPFGINRGSFLGLQAQKWLSGLTNMAVGPGGYGEIQEGLLTAGYKPYGDTQADTMGMQGMRYDKTRATLASLYAKGYQDVGANIALMQVSIESARTSTAAFTSAMDSLRVTAQRTNASMKGLTTAFTTIMKALSTGMGATGNWTTLFGTSYAEAFANSRNAALRNGGAVADLSQFGAQVQLINTPAFQQAGISFENRFMAYSNSPGMAETLAMGTDQAADQLLRFIGIGNMRGRNPREVEMMIRSRSNEVDALRQSAMAQGLVGPEVTGDINAFIEWLTANATGDPVYKSLAEKKQGAGANKIKNYYNAATYFDSVLADQQSLSKGRVNQFLQGNPQEQSQYSVLSNYYDYVGKTQKSIGWLESIIRSNDQDQTWVSYRNNKPMKLGKFLETYGDNPEVRKLMESGNLQVATSQNGAKPEDLDFSAAYNIQASEKTMQNATLSELGDTFKKGMTAWAKENNTAGDNKLKVDVGLAGLGL